MDFFDGIRVRVVGCMMKRVMGAWTKRDTMSDGEDDSHGGGFFKSSKFVVREQIRPMFSHSLNWTNHRRTSRYPSRTSTDHGDDAPALNPCQQGNDNGIWRKFFP